MIAPIYSTNPDGMGVEEVDEHKRDEHKRSFRELMADLGRPVGSPIASFLSRSGDHIRGALNGSEEHRTEQAIWNEGDELKYGGSKRTIWREGDEAFLQKVAYGYGDEAFKGGSKEMPDDGGRDKRNASQDLWRYDLHGLRGALGAYNPGSEPLTDLWRGDTWARFNRSKEPDPSAMESGQPSGHQKSDWGFNVEALPDREIPPHERGVGGLQNVQQLPDREIAPNYTQNGFTDRDGNTLSIEGAESIHAMQNHFSKAGLLGKHQGLHDDEPQGNRVNASGQETTIVAQR